MTTNSYKFKYIFILSLQSNKILNRNFKENIAKLSLHYLLESMSSLDKLLFIDLF